MRSRVVYGWSVIKTLPIKNPHPGRSVNDACLEPLKQSVATDEKKTVAEALAELSLASGRVAPALKAPKRRT